jgi:hypothetical protein
MRSARRDTRSRTRSRPARGATRTERRQPGHPAVAAATCAQVTRPGSRNGSARSTPELGPETRAFYQRTLAALNAAKVPYLVGGAYALARYTGIERHTKDLDVFVRRSDCPRLLRALTRAGCRTDLTFPHWLAKAFCGDDYVDVIFSSGNGVAAVDDLWFVHAVPGEIFDVPTRLCPPEEMIWSKAFIMERERFDGADVIHLLRARAEELDWARLLARFDRQWRVLLSHLTLFGFVYPAERTRIPASVMRELLGRLDSELEGPGPDEPVCQGTILSRAQYRVDIQQWGYKDPRQSPDGTMSSDEIALWTAAIDEE